MMGERAGGLRTGARRDVVGRAAEAGVFRVSFALAIFPVDEAIATREDNP
jgi:hypothetical protein